MIPLESDKAVLATDVLEEQTDDGVVVNKQDRVKKMFLRVCIGLGVIVLILILGLAGLRKTEFQSFPVTSPLPTVASLLPTDSEAGKKSGIKETEPVYVSRSLEGDYRANLYWPEDFDYSVTTCLWEVENREGVAIDMAWLGRKEVGCAEGMDGFDSDLLSWHEGNRLLLKDETGGVSIVDFPDKRVESVKFDSASLVFWGANKNLAYFLFTRIGDKNMGDKWTYVVTDKRLKIVKEGTITVSEDGGDTIYYDSVNDGFLFVTDVLNKEATDLAVARGENVDNGYFSTNFYFLNLTSLQLTKLLTTEPAVQAGRGCYRESIESELGVVVLKHNDAGCIGIDMKYLDSNGDIRLKL